MKECLSVAVSNDILGHVYFSQAIKLKTRGHVLLPAISDFQRSTI